MRALESVPGVLRGSTYCAFWGAQILVADVVVLPCVGCLLELGSPSVLCLGWAAWLSVQALVRVSKILG